MAFSVRAHPNGDSGYRQGIAIMVSGVLLLPVMDGISKYLTTVGHMAPGQTAFYRFFFQFLATLPVIFLFKGTDALVPRRSWPNLLRGMFLGCASLCFFTALKFMPMAESLAVFFVEPFILTALSALFLRERVRWPQWLAIVAGFAGAILIINPSFERFGAVALLPLVTATLFASYMLLNRVIGTRGDSPLVMQYVAGIGGSLVLGVVMLGGAAFGAADLTPSLPQSALAWELILILGGISAYAHLLIVWAFRAVPASILAPFQYLEIVSATFIGYIVFGDFPGPAKLIGTAIIIASGLFIFWRK
jgi:drug/metabolite transporter (DMT)-like permease